MSFPRAMLRAVTVSTVLTLHAGALARAPLVVPWPEAGTHVGEIVTVEGDVVAARTSGDTCVLEFAPDDPHAFRVVLLVPLLSNLPREPDRLYRGKRVQASGRIQRFQGRPEMVLRSPGRIPVVDVGGAAPNDPTAGTPPTAPIPPPAAPRAAAPAPAPAPPPPAAPPLAAAPSPAAAPAPAAAPPPAATP